MCWFSGVYFGYPSPSRRVFQKLANSSFYRDPNQIWIMMDNQGACNHENHDDSVFTDAFNWTASHAKSAEVYRPWFYVKSNRRQRLILQIRDMTLC